MVVVDSSGWICFFTKSAKGDLYSPFIERLDSVLTPTIVLYEVYKKIKRERGEEPARECLGQMLKTQVIPVTAQIAVLAADLSLQYSLAMADALVLATARAFEVELLTGDADFKSIPGARVL